MRKPRKTVAASSAPRKGQRGSFLASGRATAPFALLRNLDLRHDRFRPRLGAVSYLNTVPLVWGMLHGPQTDHVALSFSIPSVCAENVENGNVEAGLVPVAEIARQGLEIVPGVGITCRGMVRSILLFSRVPWNRVRALAADLSSRTSVQLARVILRERYGAEPEIHLAEPALEKMLDIADAALIIGDPALRLSLRDYPFDYLDLGNEWFVLTGLPMVFAAWAGKPGIDRENIARLTRGSYSFGQAHLDKIIEQEHRRRGVSEELARQYLTTHIRYDLGLEEQKGLEAFLELADLPRAVLSETA